jgi:hypothetical protein
MVVALAVPAALAGCGSSSSNNEDPNQVLKETFNNPTKVTSGQLNISLDGSVEGNQSGSLTATVQGPFQAEAGDSKAFPQLDLTAKVSASGSGQSFSFDGSLVTTKDNAYVEYQGQAYEVGTALFKKFTQAYQQQAAQAQAQGGQDSSSFFKQFGIDPSTWLTNVSNEGTTDVEGTETIHVHGDANVPQIVSDLGKVARQVPGGTAQRLTPSQLDQIKSYVKSASIDVYSGASDKLLRKLAVTLAIEPPSGSNAPISSVNANFSVSVSDVNQPQTITAPSNAKPIRDLLGQFGIKPGSLGALGGGSAGGQTPGGGGGPGQAYTDCLKSAQTASDFNKCAQQLQ